MNEKLGIIYRAFDSEGKSYIGQTVKTLEERKQVHWNNRKDGKIFHNALLEKGLDEFKWEILEENIPEDKLLERETYYVQVFNSQINGYNGKGNVSVFSRSIVPWNKGKNNCFSKDICAKISKSMIGKPGPNKGKTFSEEHRKKISESHKGKHWKFVNGKRTYY